MALDDLISKQTKRGKRFTPRVDEPLTRSEPKRFIDVARAGRNAGGTRNVGRGFGFRQRSNNDEDDLVWINIANLPDTVLTSDLQELFQDFNVYGVGVHYNEMGQHMGTADLFVDTVSAQAILREYANIAIDGVKIRFAIVNDHATAIPQFINNQRRAARPPIRRRNHRGFDDVQRSNSARSSRTYSRSRSPINAARKNRSNAGFENQQRNGGLKMRQMKTSDELDRELDAYMKGTKHPRIKLGD